MSSIHDHIRREEQIKAFAVSILEIAEGRLRYFRDALRAQETLELHEQPLSPAATSDEILDRAEQAVRQAGYSPTCPTKVTAVIDAEVPPRAETFADKHQVEDLRAIVRTASGKYRCNLRRGEAKARLIPDVFSTADEARAARDALELCLFASVPRRRRRAPST